MERMIKMESSYSRALPEDMLVIRDLLAKSHLPIPDPSTKDFPLMVAKIGGWIIGCAGFDPMGKSGLLRSVAVDPDFRRRGVGSRLAKEVLLLGKGLGAEEAYLLTMSESNKDFFSSLGFGPIKKEEIPPIISSSRHFSEIFPLGAIVMRKSLK